jgi:hypothetical protein
MNASPISASRRPLKAVCGFRAFAFLIMRVSKKVRGFLKPNQGKSNHFFYPGPGGFKKNPACRPQLHGILKFSTLASLLFPVLSASAQTSAGIAEVRIRGDVRCIQPMGDGSFVLGGFTAYFNGARDSQLIRVTAAGARVLFPVEVNGSVQTLALSAPWLYIGGDFQVVNGVSLPFVARVNATTGAVDATWRPAPNGDLLDIVPLATGVVLNGSFSNVGGLPRSRLAMVSATGAGRPVEGWRCDANNQVDRLVSIGGSLYAGGRFSRIGGVNRSWLARMSTGGVVDTAWNPSPNNPVFDITADGSHIYLAGGFTRIGGVTLSFAGRIPIGSGAPDTSWAPNPDSLVARICVSGDSVYLAGNFTTVSFVPQKYMARIVRTSGNVDNTWKPPLDGALLALVPDGGNGCWGGGRFDSNGTGSGFARFQNNQGTSAPSYPATIENIGAVKVIKADSAGGWLVGGDFDTVNGTKRHSLFRLTAARTVNNTWTANLGGFYTEVTSMDIAGGNVIIGGQFEVPGIGGELLYNCLLLNASTGAAVTSFVARPSSTVQAIIPQGNSWILGGNFEVVGGQNIRYLARIGPTGQADTSFIAPTPDGNVHSLLQVGNELYIGGEFTGFTFAATNIPLPFLARLNNTTLDQAWQPRPNQAVFALAVDGNSLFAGGRFTSMSRVRRKYLAQLPLGGAGTPTAWNPSPDDQVNSLRIDGGRLYAGGQFFGIAGFQWPKLARFSLGSLTLDTNFKSTGENGSVYAIEPQGGGGFLIGGSFNGWDDDFNKRSLISVTASGSPAPPPSPLIAPGDGEDLLADYFAPSGSATPAPGRTLTWEENAGLPQGMVARVQWSTDLTAWHESGETVSGITRFVSISAEDNRRTAQILSDPPDPGGNLYLRIVITAGENPPALLRP